MSTNASARKIVKLTKVNTDIVGGPARALKVGTGGTANFIDAEGNECTNYPLDAGYHPISIKQLKTGGTADDIWGLFGG